MRQDQWDRLQALEEKLLDAFLTEADPDNWTGKGIDLATMDKATRGDRYWCKRNAAATAVLCARAATLIGSAQGIGVTQPGAPTDDEAEGASAERELEAELSAAEREAEKLMKRLGKSGPANGARG